MDSCSGISVQWQETCSNWKDTVRVKLWKAPMERRPCGSNGNSMSRRISYWNEEELETGDKGDGRSTESDEEAIWQEKAEFLRTKGWRQRVAWKQKHPFELTLKEVG